MDKYRRILKKQKDDLDHIAKETENISIGLNNTIEDAEKLLLGLGYELPKKHKKNLKMNREMILNLRDWSDIEKEYENLIEIRCDKYDYMIAGISGALTGLIDLLFVGVPGEGILGKWTDMKTGEIVKIVARKSGWNEEKAKKKEKDALKSAIGFLEKKFKVNYDQQHGKIVGDTFKMNTRNHHLKSLAHSSSLLGLIFSLIDQFTEKSSFIDNGKIVRIDSNFELEGNNILAKLYSGIINWFMHLISDVAGSSGAKGRGSGIAIPFYELFQWLNIGKFGEHKKTVADISVLVFEEGYDLRHGIAMSIPVILNELLVRFLWTLKLYFKENKSIEEILELRKSKILKRILFSSYGCFCLIDLGEVYTTGMLTRMNLVAWCRFGKLGFDEIKILLTEED